MMIKYYLQLFFQGYTNKKDMLKQMQSSNIYISIPSRDGTPLSLLEAMALGLYPIVSSIDANHEWISSNNGVFVNDMSNIEEISEAMSKSMDFIYSENKDYLHSNYEQVKNKADISVNIPHFYKKSIISCIKKGT